MNCFVRLACEWATGSVCLSAFKLMVVLRSDSTEKRKKSSQGIRTYEFCRSASIRLKFPIEIRRVLSGERPKRHLVSSPILSERCQLQLQLLMAPSIIEKVYVEEPPRWEHLQKARFVFSERKRYCRLESPQRAGVANGNNGLIDSTSLRDSSTSYTEHLDSEESDEAFGNTSLCAVFPKGICFIGKCVSIECVSRSSRLRQTCLLQGNQQVCKTLSGPRIVFRF